jgi:hypothetical protein
MILISWKEIWFISLNATFLAVFYVLLGVFLSFVLHYLFDDFDESWKQRPSWYKFLDVSLEISFLAIIAFWSAYVVSLAPPLFKVRPAIDDLVDTYISGNFYLFAIFVFMEELTEKLQFMYIELFGKDFDKYLDSIGLLNALVKTN